MYIHSVHTSESTTGQNYFRSKGKSELDIKNNNNKRKLVKVEKKKEKKKQFI